MELKGSNFTLRPWKKGDEESLAKHANNKKIADNVTDSFPHPYTLKDAEEWINIRKKEGRNGKTSFAVSVDAHAVGSISIGLQDKELKYTGILGYWLGEEHWGKGIISEAISIITNHAFNELGLERVEARVFEFNAASIRVLEKNGFKKEGVLRKRIFKNNNLVDEYMFAKLKEE